MFLDISCRMRMVNQPHLHYVYIGGDLIAQLNMRGDP